MHREIPRCFSWGVFQDDGCICGWPRSGPVIAALQYQRIEPPGMILLIVFRDLRSTHRMAFDQLCAMWSKSITDFRAQLLKETMARLGLGLLIPITRAAARPVPNPKGLIIALLAGLRINAAFFEGGTYPQKTRRVPLPGATWRSKYPDGRPRLDFSTGRTFLGPALGRTCTLGRGGAGGSQKTDWRAPEQARWTSP